MPQFRVSWIKMINCEIIIEANTKELAIEDAMNGLFQQQEIDESFLDCDYYDAEPYEDQE